MSKTSFLIFVSLVGCFLLGCSEEAQEVHDPAPKLAKFHEVSTKPNSKVVRLPAVVEAAKEVDLAFQVPGRVNEIYFQEGESIQQGQVIARLDQRDYKNELVSSEADYKRAAAEFERAKKLIETDAISKSVFDQRAADVKKLKSAYDSAQKRFHDTVLKAPYDAVLAKLHIEKFENITPQQRTLTLLGSSGSSAAAQVPASLIARSNVIVPTKVTLTLDVAPETVIQTELLESAAKADPRTQTFEVRYAFQSPEGLVILPGMTGVSRQPHVDQIA